MKTMAFSVRCVREQLVREGRVHTVRGYDMRDGWVWVEAVEGGRCKRYKLNEVFGKEDLRLYVKSSGFDSVEAWWKAIEGFCGGRRKWLYVVVRVGW